MAEFDVSNTDAQEFGFQIQKEGSENAKVSYNVNKQRLFVDRTNSGSFDFGEDVKGKHSASMLPKDGKVKLHMFVDQSSVEVFGNDGCAPASNLGVGEQPK